MKNTIKSDYNKVFSNYQRLIKNTEFDSDMLKILVGRSKFNKYNFFQVTKPKNPTDKDIKALEKKLEMLKEAKKQRRELEGIKERIRKREEEWIKKNKPKQPPEPPQKPPKKPPEEEWSDGFIPEEDNVIRDNLIARIDSIIEYITGGMQLENPRRSRYFNGNTDDLKMYMADTINSLYDFRELVDKISSETVEIFAEEYEREMIDTIIEREVYWDKICDASVEWVRMCRSLMNSSLKATTEEEAIKALEDEYGDFL